MIIFDPPGSWHVTRHLYSYMKSRDLTRSFAHARCSAQPRYTARLQDCGLVHIMMSTHLTLPRVSGKNNKIRAASLGSNWV